MSQNVLSEQIQGHNIDLMYSEIVQVSRTIHIKHMTTIIKCDLTLSEPKFILYIYNGVNFFFFFDGKFWEFLKDMSGNCWFLDKNKNAPSEIILPQFELVTQHPQDQSHSIVNT